MVKRANGAEMISRHGMKHYQWWNCIAFALRLTGPPLPICKQNKHGEKQQFLKTWLRDILDLWPTVYCSVCGLSSEGRVQNIYIFHVFDRFSLPSIVHTNNIGSRYTFNLMCLLSELAKINEWNFFLLSFSFRFAELKLQKAIIKPTSVTAATATAVKTKRGGGEGE